MMSVKVRKLLHITLSAIPVILSVFGILNIIDSGFQGINELCGYPTVFPWQGYVLIGLITAAYGAMLLLICGMIYIDMKYFFFRSDKSRRDSVVYGIRLGGSAAVFAIFLIFGFSPWGFLWFLIYPILKLV